MKRQYVLLIATLIVTSNLYAGDWPQFRYDTGRTAASPDELPATLELRWTRELPAPRPAFPLEVRLGYDKSYEPVVLGNTMFVPSMVNDCVTALDTETGSERWRFFAEGPVRFAPVAAKDKIYFVSDDGYLYCLSAAEGELLWKFRGLPEGMKDRKILGNGRLISLFPARGAPVLADGVVYFAAGLWPTEGVFVHAIDAESGKAVWSNAECNHIPKSNWDHGVGQYAGLTPQGYLAIADDRLIVPCGTQLPAFMDLKTGKLHKYTMGWGGRNGLPKGCWFVACIGKYLSHGGDLFDISRPTTERFPKTKPGESDFKEHLYPGGWTRLDIERANQRELDSFRQPVLTPEVVYFTDQSIVARDLTEVGFKEIKPDDLPAHRKDDPHPDNFGGVFRTLWEFPSKLKVHLKAGNRLYLGGPGVVAAISLGSEQHPNVVWNVKIKGTPQRMLAADDKLFVVTIEGDILAFGAPQNTEPFLHTVPEPSAPVVDNSTDKANSIIESTGARNGFALVLGVDRGRIVEELARHSNLHVIAVDDDPQKVVELRKRLLEAGLYGTRTSVVLGDPLNYPFSPYLASLVISELPDDFATANGTTLANNVYHTLRPYGGVACVWGSLADRTGIANIVKGDAFPGAEVREVGDYVLLSRTGALPGAADWSHSAANAANTAASEDTFIRSPMAVLWFDGAKRWHKYPGQDQVRVSGGRVVLFEEGVLRASDVYTGREMWQVDVPFGGKPLTDANAREAVRYQRHRVWGPPASLSRATQFIVVKDAIYLSEGTSCLVFDPATGKQTDHIDLPDGLKKPWANLRVSGDYLLGNSGPVVLCVNRQTREILWQTKMERAALSLAVGNNKVFCAELTDPRRGENETSDGNMCALDLANGDRLWSRAGGSQIRYSQPLDVLVSSTGFYRGSDGEPLPLQSNPPHDEFVVKGGGLPKPGMPGYVAGDKLLAGNEETLFVYAIPSGERLGDPLKWFRRGCTGTRASTHLLTTRFRSNSAWIDLESREITPLLGVRPGCSINNNIYPANGVLNMPNLTGGCTCNFSPVSVACVPDSVVTPGSGG